MIKKLQQNLSLYIHRCTYVYVYVNTVFTVVTTQTVQHVGNVRQVMQLRLTLSFVGAARKK